MLLQSIPRSPTRLISHSILSLAAREIEHTLDLIKKLRERGLIVILISHRLNDVFAVSDRIIAMRSGEIVADKLIEETSMQDVVAQIMIA